MARPTAMDEFFVHQVPLLLPNVEQHSAHWRESYFFELHRPDAAGDVVFLTMAHYPATERMDSLQMGRIAGQPVLGRLERPYGDDPHTTDVGGARVEVVRPFEEIRLWADPDRAEIGMDLTFSARTRPYGLRRGTLRAGDDVVWDQSHILQSGVYTGTYTAGGRTYEVDGWVGQRDHSWGVRDHGRCPLWMWFQIQLEDGFLAVWHWEFANGARVYTDGCWAGTDRSEPVPVIDFAHDMTWTGPDGAPVGYGTNGEAVLGLTGGCVFTLEGGRRITVEASGTFDRPLRTVPPGRPVPDEGPDRRRPGGQRHLRDHRRPPPPLFPGYGRDRHPSGLTGSGTAHREPGEQAVIRSAGCAVHLETVSHSREDHPVAQPTTPTLAGNSGSNPVRSDADRRGWAGLVRRLAARPPLFSFLTAVMAAGGGLIIATAAIHLHLWLSGYRYVPTLGALFLTQAVSGFLLGPLLLAGRRAVLAGAGAVYMGASAVGLILSATVGFVGIHDGLGVPWATTSLVVELIGFVLLSVAALVLLLRPPGDRDPAG